MYSNPYVKMFSGNENKTNCKTCKANRKSSLCNIDTGLRLPQPARLKGSAAQSHLSFTPLLTAVTQNGSQHSHRPSSNPVSCAVTSTGLGDTAPGPAGAQEQKHSKLGLFPLPWADCTMQPLVCAQQGLPTAGLQELNHPVCIQGTVPQLLPGNSNNW